MPFTRARALELGVTRTMLGGKRFERLHHRVYRVAGAPVTYAELVAGARLALPPHALLTGISRIQELGLDFGPRLPIHFVVEGDLHLDLDGVFLHRTKALAPLVEGEMSAEGAFIAYCWLAGVIDAIKVGDWLLHNLHMDLGLLVETAGAHRWRAGAEEGSLPRQPSDHEVALTEGVRDGRLSHLRRTAATGVQPHARHRGT